jgi:hypothetical protein
MKTVALFASPQLRRPHTGLPSAPEALVAGDAGIRRFTAEPAADFGIICAYENFNRYPAFGQTPLG